MKKPLSLLAALLLSSALAAAPAHAQGEGETPPTGGATSAPAARPAPISAPSEAPSPVRTRSESAAPAANGAGPKPTGLFFEVALGGQMGVYTAGMAGTPQIGGSFLIGYKLNRLIFGLGLEYYHMATFTKDEGGGATVNEHETINAMIFQPTVQFHILESNPLALYLTAGIHVGFSLWDETGSDQDDDTGITLAGFHLGLGFRYFFHPRFALGVEGGFRGLWVIAKYEPSGGYTHTETTATGAFYGRIGFCTIW